MPPISERTYLVTGASGGLGRALALGLARRGARLAVSALADPGLDDCADACRAAGVPCLALDANVVRSQACQSVVDAVIERYGRLDGLVHAAGTATWGTVESLHETAEYERVMRTNYIGSVNCARAALPHLIHSRGRILVVASAAGLLGLPALAAYCASKHAQVGFFDALRLELRARGVSVTLAVPDFVDTGLLEPPGVPPSDTPFTLSATARPGSPERCAELLLRALEARRPRVFTSMRTRAARWLSLVSPALLDRLVARALGQPY